MRPLSDWAVGIQSSSRDEFCRLFYQPVLVRCRAMGELQPVDRTHGLTIDRPAPARLGDGKWSATLDDYTACAVQARERGRTEVTIGCSSKCDIQFNDASVSKTHAVMWREIDGWHIRDASSLTGVSVNDAMPTAAPLASGDRITLGVIELIFLMPRELYRFVRGLSV
jgi:hypothetical protein